MFTTTRFVITAALASAGLAATAATASAPVGPGARACEVPAAPVVVEAPGLPKWGIGLRMTSLSLAPEDNPDAATEYGGGGLQVRMRVGRKWQLELAMDHVTERLENGEEGTRQLQAGTLSALYHFNPYARWDWYLLAGVGGTGNGDPEISDEEREASQLGHVHLGAGLERRWGHLGLGVEFRAVGVAPSENDAMTVPEPGRPTGMPTDANTVPTSEIEAQGVSGGQLSIAATYYF